mmetsp:Transcript_8605/g.12665  ORF Transcript_8605/g.12665 Transcript_8605/m.12665 type:complete len:189 (+) Transcript_8605:57-623(+)
MPTHQDTNAPTVEQIVRVTKPPSLQPTIGDLDDNFMNGSNNLFSTDAPTSSLNTKSESLDNSTSKSSDTGPTMEEIYKDLTPEEVEYLEHREFVKGEHEAAKISIFYLSITLVLMVLTAQQLSENPDGVYANICRLAITVTGCIFKIILLPLRKVLGLGSSNGYTHHLVTMQTDFRDPYSRSNRMEII